MVESKKSLRRRRGQGMTEYIIIVGLIAIVMVPAVGKFKTALAGSFDAGSTKMNGIADQISGGGGGGGDNGSPSFGGPR
jgi:Flp pilus assembly pilin Flp